MKKRYLAVMTALVLGLSPLPVSAQAVDDPVEVLNQAVEKTSSLPSLEVQASVDINAASGGEIFYLPLGMQVKVEGVDTGDLKMQLYATLSPEGETVEVNSWYTDGCIYVDVMGTKVKYPLDLTSDQIITGISPEFDRDDFQDISGEVTGDGTQITFSMDGGALTQKSSSFLDELAGGLLEDMDVALSIQDINGRATVNAEGYLTKGSLTLPLSITVNGDTLDLDLVVNLECPSPGEDVTVEIPSLDGFEDFNWGEPDEPSTSESIAA